MEIRLCGIDQARWLHEAAHSSLASQPPEELIAKVGIGRAFARRLAETGNASQAAATPAAGMIMANKGPWFESAEFIASVAHALALAAVVRTQEAEAGDPANDLSCFVRGKPPFDGVPRLLRDAGIYSVLPRAMAWALASWIRTSMTYPFEDEVADMHGVDSVSDYISVAEGMARILESTRTHWSDLGCWLPGGHPLPQ